MWLLVHEDMIIDFGVAHYIYTASLHINACNVSKPAMDISTAHTAFPIMAGRTRNEGNAHWIDCCGTGAVVKERVSKAACMTIPYYSWVLSINRHAMCHDVSWMD